MGGGQSAPQTSFPNKHGHISNTFTEYDTDNKRILNVYKTLDKLKQGGYGIVYKAENTATKQLYALKYIPIYENADLARREAEILKKINHKSVVKIHSAFSVFENKDIIAYCIVMDYVEGKDLREYMQISRYVPKNLVVECFIKLAEALAHLHSNYIYHYDLKPENIIIAVCDDGVKVTLVDFGSAGRKFGPEAQNGNLAGTPPYMAPEFFSPRARNLTLSGKPDMWALGCILYEIWSQDSSFLSERMEKKLLRDPDFLYQLGDMSISRILGVLLEPNPENRITAELLLSNHIFRGWRVAIDENNIERLTAPTSAWFLFPFVTVLTFSSSTPSLCQSNLDFIERWLKSKDFHRVLVEFDFAVSLIKFLAQATDPNLIRTSKTILLNILNKQYGTQLAYQICANPIGISTLIERESFSELVMLLRYSFGYATLKNCYGIDNLVNRLLHSSSIERVIIGRGVYEELPYTSIPLSLFLDKIGSMSPDNTTKISAIACLMNSHKDIGALVTPIYDRFQKLLCNCLAMPGSEHQRHLLKGLLFMVKPSSHLTKCINQRICTAEITGSVKYQQYIRYCKSCNINACLSCAKQCHATCDKDLNPYYQGAVACNCPSQEGNYCKCVRHLAEDSVHSEGGRPRAASTISSSSQQDLSLETKKRTPSFGSADIPLYVPKQICSCVFNLEPLEPAPMEEVAFDSYIRCWEDKDEFKLPKQTNNDRNRFHILNKGFVLHSRGSDITTSFYYEIEILSPPVGRGASVAMGVYVPKNSKEFKTSALGWIEGEYGYHGNNGNAYFGGFKALSYGPIYSTGDRVGCGVLSDGRVYFTVNGLLLGFPQSQSQTLSLFQTTEIEAPRISADSRVYSVVTAVGLDAHIRFVLKPEHFMFNPDSKEFEATKFYQENPYGHLNLLRSAFGDNVAKIFELLESVVIDLGASLLHALCFKKPDLARILKPIFPRFSKLANSRFSHRMIQSIEKEIQDDELRGPYQLRASQHIPNISSPPTSRPLFIKQGSKPDISSPSPTRMQQNNYISPDTGNSELRRGSGGWERKMPTAMPAKLSSTSSTKLIPVPSSFPKKEDPSPLSSPGSPPIKQIIENMESSYFSEVKTPTGENGHTNNTHNRSIAPVHQPASLSYSASSGITFTRSGSTQLDLARSPSTGDIATALGIEIVGGGTPTKHQFNKLGRGSGQFSRPMSPAQITLPVCLSSDLNVVRELVLDADQQSLEGMKQAIRGVFPEMPPTATVVSINRFPSFTVIKTITYVRSLHSNEKVVFTLG